MKVNIPDIEGGPWQSLYTKDFYYNPDTELIVYSKITTSITKKELALRDRLLPYWLGKATRFRHEDKKANAECVVIRPQNEEPAVIMWGLRGLDAEWVRVVRVNDAWQLLLPHEKWEFGDWELSDDGEKLLGFALYLNDTKIAEY